MHAARIESLSRDVGTAVEHAVMTVLLASEHSPSSRAELEREVSGVNGNPMDVTDAVDCLYSSGLVHLSGELVTVTRVARRMDELRL